MRTKIHALGLACVASVAAMGLGTNAFADPGAGCTGKACSVHGELLSQRTVLRLGAAEFLALLNANPTGQQLLQLAGAPVCGIEVVSLRYRTVGGAGEPTTAGAALMVPSGGRACRGPRPAVLYAHGTSTYRGFNIADIAQTDPANSDGATEGLAIAALFAAQGYVVVASNYAGYAGSDLPYHPYLNAAQQSADVIDAWSAARQALPRTASGRQTFENGKLFLTGYSQGGHVALATHRALQAAGIPVTASAPGSGPYALAATADALIEGEVALSGPELVTFFASSYQHAYGNLYRTPQEAFEAPYATGIERLLPNQQPLDSLVAAGKLPATAVFSAVPPAPEFAVFTPPLSPPVVPPELTPLFALGFGPAALVRNSYRLGLLRDALNSPDGAFPTTSYALAPASHPTHPLRLAFKRNDLRNWLPRSPVQLCGGHDDPTVFFFNTTFEQTYWQHAHVPAGLTSVLDVDSAPAGLADPYAALKAGFSLTKSQIAAQAVGIGATDGGAGAVLLAYHDAVAPFCLLAARAFFSAF